MFSNVVEKLKSPSSRKRLKAVKKLKKEAEPKKRQIASGESVNLQIHTTYSFSPYTPSMAAYMAHKFSLTVAGITDDYTLAGAKEFIKACDILGITYSVGMELRGDFGDGYANIALFGVAQKYFKTLEKKTAKLRARQKENVLKTIEAVNKRTEKDGIVVSFEKDVKPLMKRAGCKVFSSKYVYYATAEKIIEKFSAGEETVDYILSEGLDLTQNEVGLLRDVTNPYYAYDLAQILLENYRILNVKKNYASPEEIISIGRSVGAICAYEYVLKRRGAPLSDEELIKKHTALVLRLKKLGFDAISFDPTKFSKEVLDSLLKDLEQNEMLPLHLSRVEFPRRRFDCNRIEGEENEKMINSAFAVVGSEMSENSRDGYGFNYKNVELTFAEKLKLFAKIGRKGL
ncbi:MAG TPA: hypothetical protein DDY77_03835 [Clostridiales bacterium]|nr:hypothetical protein [Clostridiales bacterium]